MDKYLHLDLYPDALASLSAMKDKKLAILSNGSPDMLDALVKNSGPRPYARCHHQHRLQKDLQAQPGRLHLIESTLHIPPNEVLFISSNPWDACGAKAFGLNVAWIERVTPEAMAQACERSELVAPLTMFKAIRTQMDELGSSPIIASTRSPNSPHWSLPESPESMSIESVRAFFAEKAPDIAVIESTMSSATVTLAPKPMVSSRRGSPRP